MLLGDVVELQPAVLAVHDALGPENLAVLAGVQLLQDVLDALGGEGLGGLHAPGGEDLVGVVMVVMVVAAAVGIVALVAVMVVVMVVLVLFVLMVVVVMMLVVILVVIVMMVAGAVGIVALILVMVVMMVMLVLVLVMMMVVMVLGLLGLMLGTHLGQELVGEGHLLDGPEDGLTVQLVPGGGDDGGIGVLLPQHGHGGLELLLRQLLGPGEDDGAGGLDLVIVELAEVLHVDLHLGGVRHGDEAVELQLGILGGGILHRHDDVAELAHAGGLDEDAVRVELGGDLL